MDSKSDAPGANDDASGTAAVMELACVMSRYEFDATLVFMAVAGEEQGLIGSGHWAKSAHARNVNVAGMFTNDIVGNSRGSDGKRYNDQVRLFAEGVPALEKTSEELRTQLSTGGENDGPTRELARFIKEAADRHVRDLKVNVIYRRDRYRRNGDHAPFLEQGYPAVRFTEAREDFRHQHQNVRIENGVQHGDLVEFVDFKYVASVTKVNAAALASLALGPAAPREAMIETTQLENDTTLRWTANTESDIAGYRIVWRETTAPFWQQHRDVGNVTRYTLQGVSKDDVVFGIVAIDKNGNASVATYPKPYRPPPRQ
jgi:putative aminopeptidase FrvX